MSRQLRPLAVALVALLLTVAPAPAPASAGPAAAAAETRSSDPLKDMGDAFLVEQDGGWFCPHNPALESTAVCPADTGEGGDSRSFAEFMVEHVVANPQLTPPMYLRAGKARNDCSIAPGAPCTTGVPPAPAEPCLAVSLPPAQYTITSPYCALQGLKDVGIQLGVVVGAAGDEDGGAKPARSVQDITYHACRINQADSANLYDFMFLDLAFKLPDADLVSVVQKIQSGVYWDPAAGAYRTCPYGGWPKLITNDTTWPARTLATGAWGHAKSFKVLEGDGWRQNAEAAADGLEPSIRTEDFDFVRAVHQQDPGGHPVLRFEVPSQTDRFAQLDSGDQCNLLRRWAKQQKQSEQAVEQFSIIYAFYVHALPDKPETYDSVYRGTFLRQRELIHYYNPDLGEQSLSVCPQ
ncbi:hypothetical protein [Nonomuraea zeae]|uniref:Uncharacterized protein n=1 Tax=Nonomuraea zeae TaxID=1642303 RepID=A0A5S4GYW0_9ACTN|nr:hypothetical protein [Nonomuraea zeae]TMR38155.1 hypothetical protein ETD85_05880 [Nonomuraea zeae]